MKLFLIQKNFFNSIQIFDIQIVKISTKKNIIQQNLFRFIDVHIFARFLNIETRFNKFKFDNRIDNNFTSFSTKFS